MRGLRILRRGWRFWPGWWIRDFVEVPHGSVGPTWVENSRFHFSRTPALVRQAGPTLGEHTWEVLSTILGYSDDRIADLAAAEVLQ